MIDPDLDTRIEDIVQRRGAAYVHLVTERRERERLRKQQARNRQTPEQRDHERDRKREARKRQTPEQREREKQRGYKRDRRKLRPFMGVDGEGGGTDELHRQNYFLMCRCVSR